MIKHWTIQAEEFEYVDKYKVSLFNGRPLRGTPYVLVKNPLTIAGIDSDILIQRGVLKWAGVGLYYFYTNKGVTADNFILVRTK